MAPTKKASMGCVHISHDATEFGFCFIDGDFVSGICQGEGGHGTAETAAHDGDVHGLTFIAREKAA
jgi:hypothetical protein